MRKIFRAILQFSCNTHTYTCRKTRWGEVSKWENTECMQIICGIVKTTAFISIWDVCIFANFHINSWPQQLYSVSKWSFVSGSGSYLAEKRAQRRKQIKWKPFLTINTQNVKWNREKTERESERGKQVKLWLFIISKP